MDGDSVKACALIPCLDGAATISTVVLGALEHVKTVIVVDDGSADSTAEMAAGAGAHVVRHEVNRGKGAALLTGLAEAQKLGFTHAVSLDGDGQHDPADMAQLLLGAAEAPVSLIIGARDFSVPNVPGGSKFGRNFSNFWVWLETGYPLTDTQSGFRVYPVELTLALNVAPSRFEWEVEIIVRAAWAGMPVRDLDISVYYPPPEERVSHYRGFVDSTRISLLHCRLVGRWMLRPFWPTRRLIPR